MPSQSLRDLESAALAQGWRVVRNNEGHYEFFPPDRTLSIVMVSDSVRGLRMAIPQLRRRGLIWPSKKGR